jgi:hypothetical protein
MHAAKAFRRPPFRAPLPSVFARNNAWIVLLSPLLFELFSPCSELLPLPIMHAALMLHHRRCV